MNLAKVVYVNKDNCVNCHRCIAVCPVKYCNDGSGDVVKINEDLCIGCGQCIKACTHDARQPVDDFEAAFEGLSNGEQVVAIVAPAVAANFPGKYLNLNGWLKSIGVDAVFDVSFGAELTVKSYLEYVKSESPKLVIAQPCPAIVNYIEIYHPELIPHLAPADSPMVHTMKMVHRFYQKYKSHKFMVISPCIAKRREFDAVGLGDYNVTLRSIKQYLDDNKIDLAGFPAEDFDNDPAERAVLFSTPGGLLETVVRELPDARKITRKIEGPEVVYEYLSGLGDSLVKGVNPLLVDCLNCDAGCNGGTGVDGENHNLDYIEMLVEKRKNEMQKRYKKSFSKVKVSSKLKRVLKKHWEDGLYERKYVDRSSNYSDRVTYPSQEKIETIYAAMEKHELSDIKNCASCGYNSCEKMAIAIHNELNKEHNCHFYMASSMQQQRDEITHEKKDREIVIENLKEMVTSVEDGISQLTASSKELEASSEEQTSASTQQASGITEVSATFEELSITARQIAQSTAQLVSSSQEVLSMLGQDQKRLEKAYGQITQISQMSSYNAKQIAELAKKSAFISEMVKIITEVANRTNLLSLNASIEAARAGDAGRGFCVVSAEIRELSKEAIASSKKVTKAAQEIRRFIARVVETAKKEVAGVNQSVGVVKNVFKSMELISSKIDSNYSFMQKIEVSTKQQESGSKQASETMKQMAEISRQSLEVSRQSMTAIKDLVDLANKLSNKTEKFKKKQNEDG